MRSMSAVSREKPSSHKHVVLAIPAPSKVNPSRRPETVMAVTEGKPPTSSTSKAKTITAARNLGESMAKAKATRPEVKGESSRRSMSSIAPVGSKPEVGTKEGAVSDVKKRKHENLPGTEGPPEKIPKPTKRSNASVERKEPSTLQERADEGIGRGSSPAAEQKPQGEIFKKNQDWDVAHLVRAIQSNRVLLLRNLAPGLHSADLAEALTEFFNHECDVRISSPDSFSFRTTSALLKFPTASTAFEVNKSMKQRNVIVFGRLVTTRIFTYQDFKPKSSTHLGHIELPKNPRDYTNEDYRDALATSHISQGNTIEFDYGVSWQLLDAQHEEQWRMLQEEFDSSKTIASKRVA